ncbi:MAG: hypothetical protein EOO38_15200 [Cytophagaceae bacterium]|nr:MAG: hypothetical protein EOO38_15200 [Cytophagaceae bacterium]
MRLIYLLICANLLTNCSSEENPDKYLPEFDGHAYIGQVISAKISWCEGGNPFPAYCEDGNRCSSCYANTLDNLGIVSLATFCIRPRSLSVADPNAGLACKQGSRGQSQVDPNSLVLIKQSIIAVDPLSLSDSYACDMNESCSTDISAFDLTVTIDQDVKTIHWSDGGASTSPRLLRLLDLLHGIGM